MALELGNIVVHSKIGQPLRASVAFALAPNEIIDTYCVSVRRAGIGSEMPGIANPRIRVADGKISITSRSPVMEPMANVSLVVKCPYTPQVIRDYLMFLDPEGTTPEVMEAAAPRPAVASTVATTTAARSPSAPAPSAPIEPASRYQVQPGDSLSGIAMRLEGRDAGLQAAMSAIFDANPDAFIGGDPNLIKAGSLVDIPSAAGIASPVSGSDFVAGDSEPSTSSDDYSDVPSYTDSSVYEGAESLQAGPVQEQPTYEFDEGSFDSDAGSSPEPVSEPADSGYEAIASDDVSDAYADLLPGDPVVEEPVVDSDVAAEPIAPAPASNPPESRQSISSPEPESGWSWLIWIAAGVLSLFGGALLIGPRLLEYFGSKPVGGSESASRPISEHAAPSSPAIAAPESTMAVEEIAPSNADVDFDLSDDSPTEENLALDADLIAGTGLAEAGDVQVNQDFGFAATAELDLELTEQAAREESPETDIIPPPERPPEDLIVEESQSPDDTEYDMSVIVDATKMPDPSEVTERDLKAVPLDDTGQTLIADEYTIDQGVDIDTLEQDFEDDFSATQALDEEIQQAAAELASELDEPVDPSGETSVEMQLANLSEIDLTATLEAQNDDLEDTAKMEAEDETVEMPSKGERNA